MGAGWTADGGTGGLRALAQPCGTTVVFPLRLAPESRLRARLSLVAGGLLPVLARVEATIRDRSGAETVLASRIIACIGSHSVPRSLGIDTSLGAATSDVDLVLRAKALTPGPLAQGTILWRGAVVDVHGTLAPALPERPPGPDPLPSATYHKGAPLISLLTPVHDPSPEMLEAALESVRHQTFEDWELCLVNDDSRDPRVVEILNAAVERDSRVRLVHREDSGGISRATNDALAMASGDYVGCLDHDDMLAKDALARFAVATAEHPNADVLYSDEELVLGERRVVLNLKPGWSPELLRSNMYMCHLTLYRRSLALEVGGYRSEFDGSQDYDFALRVTERSDRIIHVPGVLYRWRVHGQSAAGNDTAKPHAYSAARRAVEEHLRRTGIDADAHFGVFPGVYRVVHRIPDGTRAAVIVPLRGQAEDVAAAVSRAVDAWTRSEFRPDEFVLVGPRAHLSACAERLPPGGTPGQVVTVEAPPAAGLGSLLNAGASASRSEYLVLLEQPVESLTLDWLSHLVGFAGEPSVAATGAKTLAPDGRVEHAGVVLSDGIPMPVLNGAPAEEPGPLGISVMTWNLSAVTGTVATRRETFSELGGIDEDMGELGIVDYCLRAGEKGMRIVSAPDAIVREVGDVPPVNDLGALDALRTRWRHRLRTDPFFNPGYYADRADFVVRSGI